MSSNAIICETCGRPRNGTGVEGLCEVCLLEFGWRGFDEEGPAAESVPGGNGPAPPAAVWRRVGDYELLSEIARGGMGVVYRARQLTLNREVALKMILVGHWASESQVERFQLEARANARLDHPHIVPILELGEHEGWHYFSMKLVAGEDLAWQQRSGLWPAASRSDQERIAALMRTVAGAVDFAHQRGVMHRDLKPTNILIDREGMPYVTDFGLAKLVEETSDLTRTSAVLGTPAYMAPEQAAGGADGVTLAADVYSLGAMLYELLTGAPPHSGRNSLETVRSVLETEARSPSRLNAKVDADLSTICLRCLAREPAARYRSAAELADDLGRWMRREPIEARPVSTLERLGYWRRRNPLAAVLGAVLLVTLLATGIVSSVLAMRMREARDEARENAADNRRRLVQLLVDNGLRAAEAGDPVASLPWLVAALREERGDARREWPHRARIGSVFAGLPELAALWAHERLIQHAAISPDGERAATASYDGTVRIWDTASGVELGPARWHTNDGPGVTLLFHVGFSPDGTRVVSAGNRDARIWDAVTGELTVPPLTHGNEVRFAAFSPDGRKVMTASLDRTVRLWDVSNGEPIGPPLEHEGGVLTAAWSFDSRQVASGARDRSARVWEVATGRRLMVTPSHEGEITHVEFSPDGEHLVTADRSAVVRLWQSADGQMVATLNGSGGVRQARFNPEGDRLIAGCADGVARIWDWRSGELVASLPHRAGGVVWVGWSGNGRQALTASASRIQVWDAASGEALTPPLPHTHTICHAEVSADGSSLLSASADGTARLWRTGPARPRGEGSKPVLRAFGPGGRQAVLRTAGERYQLWDLRERRCVAPVLPESIGLAYAHTFNDRGDRLAVHHDNEISLFELRPQSPDAGIRRLGNWPAPWGCSLRLSADGSMLALYGPPEVRLVDARSGELVVRMVEPAGAVRHVAFDRTNRRLLTTSDGGIARVWDVADGKPLVGPLRHDDAVVFGAFSPDDTQLVTAGYDGTARIWDATTGRMLIEPLRHGALVLAAEFSPDQRWLATVVGGNWVRVWDLTSGQAVAPPLSHRTGLHYVGFLGAGGPLLTVTDDLRYQVWELASGHPLNVTGLELDLTTLNPPVSVGEGDEMWLERLPIDRRPWAELERLSILITGHRVEGEGGLVPVEVARLREAWRGE